MQPNRLAATGAARQPASTGGLAQLAQELRNQASGRVLVLQGSSRARTQLAQALALEMGLRLELAAVVAKYIGETEKNLSRILAQSNHRSALLFFDEADALFGRRTDVKDSHDRYANDLAGRLRSFHGVLLLGVDYKENLPHPLLLASRVIATRDIWPPR